MIPLPALLAISLPEHPTFADNLQFQLTGLLVVLFTLSALAILVSLIGRIFIAAQKQRPPTSAPSPATGEAIPGPVFAAIAAAVSTALADQRFVIRGVQAVDPRQNLAWGAEGRRSIYASRKIR
ncbi:MAG: OadG family transporter subunit [Chthoniobacterales bacterium]